MSTEQMCACGTLLRVPAGVKATELVCPNCQTAVQFAPAATEYPFAASTANPELASPPTSGQRMIARLLDPRSIQTMLLLGGGLMVLGLIVWLVSLGIFENTLVAATALTLGSLAIHWSGCGVMLKSRYKLAGQALALLGCILLPLNLWFYHYHSLMTLDGNLWVGGVACCLVYAASMLLLRDPLFLYAIEGGVTLTLVLLLGHQGLVTDVGWLTVLLLGLGFVSVHAERAFPAEHKDFDRARFGLPLFWSGHVQIAAGLVALLGSQLLDATLIPGRTWLNWTWAGSWLTDNALLAGTIWLVAAYVYLYSDFIVRRAGIYTYLAAACLLGAEFSFLYDHLSAAYFAVVFAATGLVLQIVARWNTPSIQTAPTAATRRVTDYRQAAGNCAVGLMSLAFFTSLLQGLARLATSQVDWSLVVAQGVTGMLCLGAIAVAPSGLWRRLYATWSIGLGCIMLLSLNAMLHLNSWQKAEIFAVILGSGLLIAGFIGRFTERDRDEDEGVTLCLLMGSLLATSALLIATLYHRFVGQGPSLPDELGLVFATVLMLVTGFSWQLRAPTVCGGIGLTTYLLVLVGMLAYFPDVTMGMYLAIGGAVLFIAGIALSIYRERLLAVPGQISRREGVFQVLNWR